MVKVRTNDNQLEDGLQEMREFYQGERERSAVVRSYLETAFKDEALLKRFLIGRKYRPKHAWENLRSYAEVRLEKYPEMFPATLPPIQIIFDENNQPFMGILKGRDSKGRRIAYFESGWDTDKCSLEELSIYLVQIGQKAFLDEDGLNNGFIMVHDSSKAKMAHVKQHTLPTIIRWINIFCNSFPLKVKGLYFVNVPTVFAYIFAMAKPFMPKKLKDRLIVTTTSQGFQDLHQRLPIDILPKFLGGNLETDEASDLNFIDF